MEKFTFENYVGEILEIGAPSLARAIELLVTKAFANTERLPLEVLLDIFTHDLVVKSEGEVVKVIEALNLADFEDFCTLMNMLTLAGRDKEFERKVLADFLES